MDEHTKELQNLMAQIISVQHNDLCQQKTLCLQLEELANTYEDDYARAFAHAYLADWAINSRSHKDCYEQLQKAFTISNQNQYTDLLLKLYNIFGIYHASHFDEISAVQNYLDGLKIAQEVNAVDQQMGILNNIASLFNEKEDLDDALIYIEQAYQLFLAHRKPSLSHTDLIVILNTTELYLKADRVEDAKQIYLNYIPAIKAGDDQNNLPVIKVVELYLAFKAKDMENTRKLMDYFIDSDLYTSAYKHLYFAIYRDVFQFALKLEDKERSECLLRCMGSICLSDDIEQQLVLHLCWINFAETFHMEDALLISYKQYYQLQKQINDVTNKFKADSMKEKILINSIRDENEHIIKEKQLLESKVKIDGLTKLFNRAYFMNLVENLQKNDSIETIGIILLDVDYFKQYNDFYGHYQGDQVLQHVANCLDMNTDSRIFAARYGGDEFICACVNMTNKEIEDYLERVKKELSNLHIEHKKSSAIHMVSLSAGYINMKNDEQFSLNVAVNVADNELYKIKTEGRNNYTRY